MSTVPPADAPTLLDPDPPGGGAGCAREATAGPGSAMLAGRYELVGLLGSGGMGTVYRARDHELDEVVALKVLKRELARAPDMLERFRREVKLARRVTHRNVARTFDIGEDGADKFLTMEFVPGESLFALVTRSRRLSPGRTIAIARELCAGLAASHDAGVVHGDLKPENVLCESSGRVVITDFGIARAFSPDANESRTLGLIGTPAYMSPEQVEGTGALDGRTDLYALGCILFRLLTGEPAWTGASYVSVAAARLLHPPPDPRERLADIPDALAAIVLRCMARERAERFATATELGDALAAAAESAGTATGRRPDVVTPALVGSTKSVAVLPLEGAGEEDAYLAHGLRDDLIDGLSAVPQLVVRPRGSCIHLAGKDRDPREAGRTLDVDVDVVVEGGLRRQPDGNVKATLRVLTVADGFQLWARRYERPAHAMPQVADEAAADISAVLASRKVAPQDRTSDATALDLYLRGRFVYASSYFGAGEAAGLLRGAYERAPEDGRIAAAYAQALVRAVHIDRLPREAAAEARAIAERVAARAPEIAAAHVVLAHLHLAEGDGAAAARDLLRALRAEPANADALSWMGSLETEVGRLAEGIRRLLLARTYDPTLAYVDGILTRAHALLGDFEAGERLLAGRTSAQDDVRFAWTVRSRYVLWRRDRQRAETFLAALARAGFAPDTTLPLQAILWPLSREGLTDERLATIDRVLGPSPSPRRAAFHAQLKLEIYGAAGLAERARPVLGELLGMPFLDLAWLDGCPLLECLKDVPELAALRAATAERAARVCEVLDAGASALDARA